MIGKIVCFKTRIVTNVEGWKCANVYMVRFPQLINFVVNYPFKVEINIKTAREDELRSVVMCPYSKAISYQLCSVCLT